MKKLAAYILLGFLVVSCNSLDLNPLTQASTENWYTTEEGIVSSINYLYSSEFWCSSLVNDQTSEEWSELWTDDMICRNLLSAVTNSTINSQTGFVIEVWELRYKCIANATAVMEALDKMDGVLSQEKINKYRALARFARAYQYSLLVTLFGDVPYYETSSSIEDALSMPRTSKEEVLKKIYEDFDFAVANLPVTYSSSDLQYPTKGAAYGFKARIALRMSDWAVAKVAAKACMDLNAYELIPDFRNVITEKQTKETVLARPRDVGLGVIIFKTKGNQVRTRTPGGTDYVSPSWDLFCSFLCSDGLPIDKSPLYNPQKPFENRDPRCTATITEFGTRHLGVVYQPHPDTVNVYSFVKGMAVKNNDSKVNTKWAAFNGLCWEKGITENYYLDHSLCDPDDVLMRYSDILLMYAEAKIETNDIDQSVLDAINKVRARAYGVSYTEISKYPAVTATSQSALRTAVRVERRMEFALENLRYFDIIRWKIADKVLNTPNYGLLELADLRSKVVNQGLWFFPGTPSIDENGCPDFSEIAKTGLIQLLSNRVFDASKQYLWPIPYTDIQINENISQNPGY